MAGGKILGTATHIQRDGNAGIIPVREVPSPETKDITSEAAAMQMANAMASIKKDLSALARRAQDLTKPVDEYQIESTISPVTGISTLEVLPQFDIYNERIESVLVTGPASTAFTLNLGDRSWTLVTSVSGIVHIAPLGAILSRADRRILTSTTPGAWTLELCGWADEQF